MIAQLPRILWPAKIALVHLTADNAYELQFVRETPIEEKVNVSQNSSSRFLAFEHTYPCKITEAHYLSRVYVRPLFGNWPQPNGRLVVHLDGSLVLDMPLGDALPAQEPIDPLEAYPWKTGNWVFQAHAMRGRVADKDHQIGFMMTNLSKLEVFLHDVVVKEKETLEVGILSALYHWKEKTV